MHARRRVMGERDRGVGEASGRQAVQVLAPGQGTSNAAHVGSCCCRSASVMSSCATTLEMPIRPPGTSTRNISASTACLSVEKLITQLAITTSTAASASGHGFYLAIEELHVGGAGLGGVGASEHEHVLGHIDASTVNA